MNLRVLFSLLLFVCCVLLHDASAGTRLDHHPGGVVRRHLMGLHQSKKQRRCPRNEVYLTCGPNCQRECPTLNQPCLIRHITCPEGCFCRDTFARDTIGGACIPVSQCQKRGPFVY